MISIEDSNPKALDLSSRELETLIYKAKSGDKQSFELLYTTLYTPLFRFVKSRTGNHDKALDICQEVFLRWYKTFESYEIKMKPLSYLIMIAMRLIINDTKKIKSLSLSDELEEILVDDSISPADIKFDLSNDFAQVHDMFTLLSENQQNVLTMRYIADADTETIAEALDLSHANVRKLESRALQKLRDLLNTNAEYRLTNNQNE